MWGSSMFALGGGSWPFSVSTSPARAASTRRPPRPPAFSQSLLRISEQTFSSLQMHMRRSGAKDGASLGSRSASFSSFLSSFFYCGQTRPVHVVLSETTKEGRDSNPPTREDGRESVCRSSNLAHKSRGRRGPTKKHCTHHKAKGNNQKPAQRRSLEFLIDTTYASTSSSSSSSSISSSPSHNPPNLTHNLLGRARPFGGQARVAQQGVRFGLTAAEGLVDFRRVGTAAHGQHGLFLGLCFGGWMVFCVWGGGGLFSLPCGNGGRLLAPCPPCPGPPLQTRQRHQRS